MVFKRRFGMNSVHIIFSLNTKYNYEVYSSYKKSNKNMILYKNNNPIKYNYMDFISSYLETTMLLKRLVRLDINERN